MTIQDLSKRFGISEKSVRRRLDSLDPVISQHLATGRQNAILVSSSGMAIFDRLMQIEREEKLSPSAAAEKVIRELANGGNGVSDQGVSSDQSVPGLGLGPGGVDQLIGVLKSQIGDLRAERDRLLSLIEQQGEQLRALMPGPSESESEGNGRGAPRISRWQHLKAALLGRT